MMDSDRTMTVIQGGGRALQDALARARLVEAERSDVIVDLKAMETTRLEALRDALGGVFSEIPADNLQFDLALQRGSEPRLWIDMIAFVVMGRDRETYRFLQDSLNGRRVLFEDKDPEKLVARVTDYLAFRLIEREKAIAEIDGEGLRSAPAPDPQPMPAPPDAAAPARMSAGLGWFLFGMVFGVAGLLVIGWLVTMPG